MSATAITISILIFILLVILSLFHLSSLNEIDSPRRNLRGHIFTRGRRSKYAERWDVA